MSDKKQTRVRIRCYHIECSPRIMEGEFLLTFYGKTEKEKRYKIEITMKLYFISFIAEKLLEVRTYWQKKLDAEFASFKEKTS